MNRPELIDFARRLFETCHTQPFNNISHLARVTGVDRYTVQNWLAASTVPSGRALARLARKGIDIGWLLTGEPTTPKVTALEEAAR